MFNTNPTITNTAITSQATLSSSQGGRYFLGETFERSLTAKGDASIGVLGKTAGGANISSKAHAVIWPLRDQVDATLQQNKFKFAATKATTGFFIAQDLSGDTASYTAKAQQKLFRVEALTAGQWAQESIKISIEKIKAPRGEFEDYGTFSLVVRKISDIDTAPVVLERYDLLNLNPASPNFIGQVIGTQYEQYDDKIKGNRVYGAYPNKSKYIRIELDAEVERGSLDPRYLPFGVFGPLKYRDVTVVSGAQSFVAAAPSLVPTSASNAANSITDKTMVFGGGQLTQGQVTGFGDIGGSPVHLPTNIVGETGGTGSVLTFGNEFKNNAVAGGGGFSGSIVFPSVPLRTQSVWGRPRSNTSVYWGAWTGRTATDPKVNEGLVDLLRVRAEGLETNPSSTDRDLEGEITKRTSDPPGS